MKDPLTGINNLFEESELNQEFSKMLSYIVQFIKLKKYNEALKLVNSFYHDNCHVYKNLQSELKEKCNKWLGVIHEKSGNYGEALRLYKIVAQSLKPHYTLFINNRTDIVRVLKEMGNFEQAITETELIIDQQINGDIFDLLPLLLHYVECLDASNRKFSDKYRPLIKIIAKELAINLPDEDCDTSHGLIKVVKHINTLNHLANKRYSKLIIQLDQIQDINQLSSILRKYISEESFEFYRNMAIEELETLNNGV